MAELRTTSPSEQSVRMADSTSRAPGALTPPASHDGRTLFGIAIVAVLTLLCAAHPDVPLVAALAVIATIPALLVDLRERRLPNELVGLAGIVAVAGVVVMAIVGAEPEAARALAGSLLMSVPLLIMHLISPSSMGFGDVKLAAVLGFSLGLVTPVLALAGLMIACAAAVAVGLARRRRSVAFGPALALGAALALMLVASPLPVLEATRIDSRATLEGPE